MGTDIMTNLKMDCERVSPEFAEYLNDRAEDFDIRYCYIPLTKDVKDHLSRIVETSGHTGDCAVAQALLDEGADEDEDGNPCAAVEIMIG